MTKNDIRIANAANAILWLWNDTARASKGNCWYKQDARQAYQDSLIAMVSCGLIEDYDMVKIQVKIKGTWTASRQVTVM